MGLQFINRTLKITGLLLVIFLPFGLYYIGMWFSLAVLFGGVWSMINLIFITALVRVAIRPEGADKGRALGLAFIKFPLLYTAGYFLATAPQFDPVHLLIGFSAPLAVMLLKVVGRSLLSVNPTPNENNNEVHRTA